MASRRIGLRRALGLALAAFFVSASTEAGLLSALNPFNWFSDEGRVETLMITGNYARSRLLAELAQVKTEQPVLLVSPAASGGSDLFFLPAAPEAMEVEKAKYGEFVRFLQPERIVVLGDAGFVPPEFVDKVRDRYPTVILASEDWIDNAAALARILEVPKLTSRYIDLLAQLDAVGTAPAPAEGRMLEMDAPAPEPMALPQSAVPIQ